MTDLDTVLRCLGTEYEGPGEPTAEAMLSAFRTVIRPRSAVYVSSPITTGENYLDWRATNQDDLVALNRSFQSKVIDANIKRADGVVKRTRARFWMRPVIDPTMLEDRPDWEQHHYHSFWLAVITEFVGDIIFTDSWQFSNGCVLEYLQARKFGVPALTERYETLSAGSAELLIANALDRYSKVGIEMPIIVEGLTLLQSREN